MEQNDVSNSKSKQQVYFTSWYAKNAEKLKAQRKEKYDNDPNYRQKIRESAEKYRAEKAKLPKKPRKKIDKTTIPTLCEKAGCSPHTFRKYVAQGWIPKGAIHVNFNETHIKLLADLCTAAKDLKYEREDRIGKLQPFIDAIHANWK